MRPVEFKESTKELAPPKAMREGDICLPLPVFTDGQDVVSCWQFTPEELEEMQRTGKLWLTVLSGQTQPPVAISAFSPFEHAKK